MAEAAAAPAKAKAEKAKKEEVAKEEVVAAADQARLAEIVKVLGRTGSRGNVTQVRAKLLGDDRDANRTITRNVKGPCKVGDMLALMETEREARRMR